MGRPRCAANSYVGESCRNVAVKNGKYCSSKCQKRIAYLKNKGNKKQKVVKQKASSTSRGPLYHTFVSTYAKKIEDKNLTHNQVAELLDTVRTTVTKMYAAYLEDKQSFEAQKDWEVSKETKMYSPRSCRSQRMGKKTQRI